MQLRAGLSRALLVIVLAGLPVAAAAWSPRSLFAPCDGDCAVALFGGNYVENSMNDVLLFDPELPFTWDYDGSDHLVGTSVSRRVATINHHVDVEPEVGMAQRFGRQSATEIWGAFYFRYRGFPWDNVVTTTVALSTGINWASEITDVERDRARDQEGSQWMHYFAPEVTFALPQRPDLELMFRFHHRSGVFGLVSDAHGGAQYGTVGLRVRF